MARQQIAEVTRHASIVFFSTLALQTTGFIILAVSGRMLDVAAFARLSLISAACMLAVSAFDLGLNLTTTKMYGDTGDVAHFRFAFAVRLLLVAAAPVIGGAVEAMGARGLGVGIALAGVFNLWSGIRATDQARQDYRSFSVASLWFAVLRAACGVAAFLVWPEPEVIAAAMYALPIVAIVTSRSFPMVLGAFHHFAWPSATVLRYTVMVHLNQVLFLLVPYAPQFLVNARLSNADVGRYGLILTFAAPISLVITSVRDVLLPKMFGPSSDFEKLLWSRKGAVAIGGLWLALMIGGVLAGLLIEIFYGSKYPNTLWPFLIFYAGFTTTGMIGFTSLSMHTQGVPHYAVLASLVKAILFAPLLAVFGSSLTAIVTVTALVMVIGELPLTFALLRRRNRLG